MATMNSPLKSSGEFGLFLNESDTGSMDMLVKRLAEITAPRP